MASPRRESGGCASNTEHAILTLMLTTYVMKDKIITLLLTLAFSSLILLLWPVLAYFFKIEDKDNDP